MDLLTKMVEHHVWLTGQIVEHAARLTDEQLDELIELNVDDDRPDDPLAAVPPRRPDGHVERRDRATRLRLVRRGARVASTRCATGWPSRARRTSPRSARSPTQGRLDDTFVDALCEPAEVFTYGGMIAHVLTFAAHRRCLVVMALDKHGVSDLGWGDPMRWVRSSRRSAGETPVRLNGRVDVALSLVRPGGRRHRRRRRSADRFDLPAPIVLVALGAAASFLPFVPEVHLTSEVVLVGLLPPLLYAAALQTSLVDFNANRRAILLLSIGLVAFTTVGVAVVATSCMPDVTLAGGVRARGRRRAAGRRRRDRDRPPDRHPAPDRHDPRG